MEISTPLEAAVETHFHVQHGTKASLVFLPAEEKPLGRLFQIWSPYY